MWSRSSKHCKPSGRVLAHHIVKGYSFEFTSSYTIDAYETATYIEDVKYIMNVFVWNMYYHLIGKENSKFSLGGGRADKAHHPGLSFGGGGVHYVYHPVIIKEENGLSLGAGRVHYVHHPVLIKEEN